MGVLFVPPALSSCGPSLTEGSPLMFKARLPHGVLAQILNQKAGIWRVSWMRSGRSFVQKRASGCQG